MFFLIFYSVSDIMCSIFLWYRNVIINATLFICEADNSLYAFVNNVSVFSGKISVKLPQIYIVWVAIAEKVFKIRAQMWWSWPDQLTSNGKDINFDSVALRLTSSIYYYHATVVICHVLMPPGCISTVQRQWDSCVWDEYTHWRRNNGGSNWGKRLHLSVLGLPMGTWLPCRSYITLKSRSYSCFHSHAEPFWSYSSVWMLSDIMP